MSQIIRSADGCNQQDLLSFVNSPVLAYEHLDWFSSKSRLTEVSTFCLYTPEQLEAILSVAPETDEFAWIRFFFAHRDGKHSVNFSLLLDHARIWLKNQGVPRLFSLSSSEWYENLLIENGFYVQNQIVSLVTNKISGILRQRPAEFVQRPTRLDDLPEIGELDKLCFSPPWQLNQASLERCYYSGEHLSLATVAGKLVAYQITTRFLDHLHLARIAVHPDFRGRGIAKALLLDLAAHFDDNGIESISVNTQVDNSDSLRLYESLGFKKEGDLLAVYCFDLI